MFTGPSKTQLEVEDEVRMMEEQVFLDEIAYAHSWNTIRSTGKFWTLVGTPMIVGTYFVNSGLRRLIRQAQSMVLPF